MGPKSYVYGKENTRYTFEIILFVLIVDKIRVVHIISNVSSGGAQVLLYDILSYLIRKENLEIFIITIDSGDYYDRFSNKFEIIDLKRKGLLNPNIYFKIRKILRKLNPRIVHTHLLKADFYGRLAARSIKTPIIFSTLHTHSTSHRLRKGAGRSLYDLIDNFTISFSKTKIIAVSNYIKDYIRIRKENISENVDVIYNGIDLKKETYILSELQQLKYREKLCLKESNFVISIIGRLEESKGQVFFLESASEFIKSSGVKVLIIGSGSQHDLLQRIIKTKKLDSSVFIMGQRDDIEELIEISDLIAVPSLWEGFGIVILEAMIKKKLVLASDVGGIPEIVIDNKTGFLFKSGNKNSLLDRLKYILSNSEKFEEVKENALSIVKEKFDIEKNAELYYNIYMSELKNLANY